MAARLISASGLRDGLGNLRHAVRDLHDAHPETTDRKHRDPTVGRVHTAVSGLHWVEACDVRLHEEGPHCAGWSSSVRATAARCPRGWPKPGAWRGRCTGGWTRWVATFERATEDEAQPSR